MRKCANVSPYMRRRPLVIYDFATAPFWISYYMGKILFSILSVHRDQEIVVVVLHLTFVLFQTRAQLDSSHGRHPPEAAVRGRLPLLHLRVPRVLRMTRPYRQLSILPAVILTAENAESPVCHLGLSLWLYIVHTRPWAYQPHEMTILLLPTSTSDAVVCTVHTVKHVLRMLYGVTTLWSRLRRENLLSICVNTPLGIMLFNNIAPIMSIFAWMTSLFIFPVFRFIYICQ